MPDTPARVRRMARNKKKDPRLIIGIALMIASMIVGALAFTALSATTDIAVATRDIAEGDVLEPSDLRVVEVRVGEAQGKYISDLSTLPKGALATTRILEGEFLPRSAVGQPKESALRPVSINIDRQLSTSLSQGDVVEVWTTDADAEDSARALVERAVVRSVSEGGGLGMADTRVEILVNTSAVPAILDAMAADDSLYVIEVPGQYEVFE